MVLKTYFETMPFGRKELSQGKLKTIPREPFTMEAFDLPPVEPPVKKPRRKEKLGTQDKASVHHNITTPVIPSYESISPEQTEKGRFEHVGNGYVRLLKPYIQRPTKFDYDVSRLIFPLCAVEQKKDPQTSGPPCPGQIRPPAGLRHRCREGLYDADDCLYEAVRDR